ncbi:MAG: tetratricopeptide repeat protein [Blastocatellia bacterium]
MSQIQMDFTAAAEAARGLTDLQRRLLQCMREKGPGLLLELAVRVYQFPEEVQAPLRELQAAGLVQAQSVAGGQFGAELYSLTAAGERALQLLNDPAFQRAPVAVDSALSAAQEARRQEADLLRQMGDVAKEAGDLAKALEYYEKALEITRELSAATGGSK